jgi:hypothetical protein
MGPGVQNEASASLAQEIVFRVPQFLGVSIITLVIRDPLFPPISLHIFLRYTAASATWSVWYVHCCQSKMGSKEYSSPSGIKVVYMADSDVDNCARILPSVLSSGEVVEQHALKV